MELQRRMAAGEKLPFDKVGEPNAHLGVCVSVLVGLRYSASDYIFDVLVLVARASTSAVWQRVLGVNVSSCLLPQ